MSFGRLLTITGLFLLPLTSSYAFLGPDNYSVVGVKGSDTLNLRSTASTRGKIVARVPFNELKVKNLGARSNGWCNVQYGNVKGWAACNYLVESSDIRHYIAQGYPMPLAVQKEPRLNSGILTRLPLNAKNIMGATKDTCTTSEWCRITYEGFQGYVQKKYLVSARAPVHTPAPMPPSRPPITITPQPRS